MRKWIPPLAIVAAFAASAAVYSRLPERVPTHWNLQGEVDGWSSLPWGAFMFPLMLLGIHGMFYLLPKIDPRSSNYAKFQPTYEILIIAVMLFMLGMHLLMLAAALGHEVAMNRVAPAGIGLLLIVLGNVMPRTRSNWFVGIRTPWTLSSDRVWERTHRVGGHLLVAAGAVTMLAAIFAPAHTHQVLIGGVVVASVGSLVYSYVVWRNDPARETGRHGRA